MNEKQQKRQRKQERIKMLYELERLVMTDGDEGEVKKLMSNLNISSKSKKTGEPFSWAAYKRLAAQGKTKKEIAEILDITVIYLNTCIRKNSRVRKQ